jgi:hypothetical protein
MKLGFLASLALMVKSCNPMRDKEKYSIDWNIMLVNNDWKIESYIKIAFFDTKFYFVRLHYDFGFLVQINDVIEE